MDAQRFDQIAKTIATGTTRRGFLRLLGGGAAAGALSLLGAKSAAAGRCRDTGAGCVDDANCCSGICGDGTCQDERPKPEPEPEDERPKPEPEPEPECRQDADCAGDETCREGRCVAVDRELTPDILPGCDCANLNFCSGHGTCTSACSCECDGDFFGATCSDLPPVDCAGLATCTDCQAHLSDGCTFCGLTTDLSTGVCSVVSECIIAVEVCPI
jgi:hypothetical protein